MVEITVDQLDEVTADDRTSGAIGAIDLRRALQKLEPDDRALLARRSMTSSPDRHEPHEDLEHAKRRLGAQFWIELALGALSLVLTIGTIVVHDWIEALFHIEPDAGGGSLEALVTVVAVAVTVGFELAARFEWRRAVREPA